MPVQVIRYKKIVNTGLRSQTINFAESGAMGHRVGIKMNTDHMNRYFRWMRAKDEVSPTGHFFNDPSGTDLLGGAVPSFYNAILLALQQGFTDQDGVATGLNFASQALEQSGDTKRNSAIVNAGAATHYSSNDLVMAYVLYKCYGSSSVDIADLIYNIEDAYGMLEDSTLSQNILVSLSGEEFLAQQCVMPNVPVASQTPGANKGAVDAMFRNLLALDPIRYFDASGVQVKGLFETSTDVDASGSWNLLDGDRVEIPLNFVFKAPVNVLSVQDSIRNPSSSTPLEPNTTFIKGEAEDFDVNGPTAAAMSNTFRIRLQLTCVSYKTAGSSEIKPLSPLKVSGIPVDASGVYYVGQTITQLNVAKWFKGGNGYIVYSCPSPLPAGMFLAPNGVLYGTPTGTTNNTTYTIIATDALGSTASVNMTFIVVQPLQQTLPLPLFQGYATDLSGFYLNLNNYFVGGIKPYTFKYPDTTSPGSPWVPVDIFDAPLMEVGELSGNVVGLAGSPGYPDASYNIIVEDNSPYNTQITLELYMVLLLGQKLKAWNNTALIAPGANLHLVVGQPLTEATGVVSNREFKLLTSGGLGTYTVTVSGQTFGAAFDPYTGDLIQAPTYAGGPSNITLTVTDLSGAEDSVTFKLFASSELFVNPAAAKSVSIVDISGSGAVGVPEFKVVNVAGGYLGVTYALDTASAAWVGANLPPVTGTDGLDQNTGLFKVPKGDFPPGSVVVPGYVKRLTVVVTNSLATVKFSKTSLSCPITFTV